MLLEICCFSVTLYIKHMGMGNKQTMETDLVRIKELASGSESENMAFRSFLKGMDGNAVDRIVQSLHKEVSLQVDCTLCGNCCSSLKPGISRNDIKILAALEGISPEEYVSGYCQEDEFDGTFLKDTPCRYLEGKRCGIYENRPGQCRKFPYTGEKGFTSRLWGILDFYGICPIVFNVMERLKDRLGFRYRKLNYP